MKARRPIVEEEDCETCEGLNIFKKKNQEINQQPTKNNQDVKKESEFWPKRTAPNGEELGNSTWTLLHTMAAYYPKAPSSEKTQETRNFLNSIAKLYPCKICAEDFQQIITKSPPRLENRHEFSQWMCEAHNQVNEHLGKPSFDCSKVDERWRREVNHKGN